MTPVLDTQDDDPIAVARRTIATEIAGLGQLLDGIDQSFVDVTRMIHACKGRVVVTGIGKSGHIGLKMAATFASTGTPAMFLHAAEAAHGDLGMIGDQDIVLAISNSGESSELRAILEYCRRFDTPLVAITARPDSTLGRFASAILRLPNAQEACPLELAPMTSTTMTLVLGDALAAALIRLRGFGRENFARFHPAGKLGAQLMTVADVLTRMPTLAVLPRVGEDTDMPTVIATMTEGRRGVTAVEDATGHVTGVITDGDLRRALKDRSIFDKRAVDIMKRDPLTIAPDRIAVEALAICEKHRISALFVTDATGTLHGMIHLKDLLELGIV